MEASPASLAIDVTLFEETPQPVTDSLDSDRDLEYPLSGPRLLAELDIPGNWSGKGQHVEFSRHEAIPLEEGTFLGRGTFADVYEVKCRGFSMARKQIYCTRRMKLADVKRELDILKKLSHKHVVTLVGSYIQNKQNNILGLLLHPVAVCDLGTFLEELDENQKLDPVDFSEDFKKLMERLGYQNNENGMKRRLRMVYGCLASAINYLHDNDIRHKDIKPRNILLGRHDDLYVTDFGLSRDTSDASSSVTDGIERGTYKYCAPEVARFEARGRAADVYSLGCVFLEIATVFRQQSLTAFEEFRTENDDRSYQNSPQRLLEWIAKLRQSRSDRDLNPIFDIVDVIGKMVSPFAKDRPVIASVCANLYLFGDETYFGKCCPSMRYSELMDENARLKHNLKMLREQRLEMDRLHSLAKADQVTNFEYKIQEMKAELKNAEECHLINIHKLEAELQEDKDLHRAELQDTEVYHVINRHKLEAKLQEDKDLHLAELKDTEEYHLTNIHKLEAKLQEDKDLHLAELSELRAKFQQERDHLQVLALYAASQEEQPRTAHAITEQPRLSDCRARTIQSDATKEIYDEAQHGILEPLTPSTAFQEEHPTHTPNPSNHSIESKKYKEAQHGSIEVDKAVGEEARRAIRAKGSATKATIEYPSKGHKKSSTIAGIAERSIFSGIFNRRSESSRAKQLTRLQDEDYSLMRPPLSRRDAWRGSQTMFQSRMLDED